MQRLPQIQSVIVWFRVRTHLSNQPIQHASQDCQEFLGRMCRKTDNGSTSFPFLLVLRQDVRPRQARVPLAELKPKRKNASECPPVPLAQSGCKTARMNGHRVKDTCRQVNIVQHHPVLHRTKHMRVRAFMVPDTPHQFRGAFLQTEDIRYSPFVSQGLLMLLPCCFPQERQIINGNAQ